MSASQTPSPSDREIVTTRLLDFPRALVFKAWTHPTHLANWWGPRGYTSTFQEFDPRPDGFWRYVMNSPEGRSYQNESVFDAVIPTERVVFRQLSMPHFQVTIIFTAEGNKTRLTWRMGFESATDCRNVKRYAVDANEQSLDRLEAELARMG